MTRQTAQGARGGDVAGHAERLLRFADRMLERGWTSKAVKALMLARRAARHERDFGAVLRARHVLWVLGRDGRGHRL